MKKLFSLIFLGPLSVCAQPAGNLDLSFNSTGYNVTNVGSSEDKAYDLAILSDGKILVVGTSFNSSTGKDFMVLRYNSDGTLDAGFGSNGKVLTDLNIGSEDIAYELAVLADGSFILAGSSDNGTDRDAALVKYNADGSLFSTFGTNGIVLTDLDANKQDIYKCVKVHQLTGKVIAGGAAQIDDNLAKPAVVRYNEDGSLDDTFNSTGIRLMWITNLDDQYLYMVEDVAVASNGKITAVGWRDFPNLSWDSDMVAFKINSDGSMDNTFSTDGEEVYNGGFNGHDQLYATLLNPDQSFLAVGRSYVSNLAYDGIFVGIDTDGSVSNSTNTDFANGLGYYDMALDMNGNIVTCGYSGDKGLASRILSANNNFDASFGSSGTLDFDFNQSTEALFYGIAVQTDNKIVVVGWKDNDVLIARLLGEGLPQLNEFNLQTPANNAINLPIGTTNFNWTDAFGATGYNIQVATDDQFTNIIADANTTASSYTFSSGLTLNTFYWWRVRATDGTAFGDWLSPFKFKTVTGVGMEELTFPSLMVFPNPSNNLVNIQFENTLDVKLQVVNPLGELVYSVAANQVKQLVVPTSSFSNGVYTLVLESNGVSCQRKLTIIH